MQDFILHALRTDPEIAVFLAWVRQSGNRDRSGQSNDAQCCGKGATQQSYGDCLRHT